jgi:hypothetical protein
MVEINMAHHGTTRALQDAEIAYWIKKCGVCAESGRERMASALAAVAGRPTKPASGGEETMAHERVAEE